MALTFKTLNERDEYLELPKRNPKLLDLLIDLTAYTAKKHGKDITLTSVYRDEEEQKDLYKESPTRPAASPHCTWQAVDLRSSTLTQEEMDDMCAYLNSRYKNANGKVVAFTHKIPGNVMHFHLQLYR
jgi:hypothetical protein